MDFKVQGNCISIMAYAHVAFIGWASSPNPTGIEANSGYLRASTAAQLHRYVHFLLWRGLTISESFASNMAIAKLLNSRLSE